jgi:hypothetical protein
VRLQARRSVSVAARLLKYDAAGTVYHVMACGAGGKTVFEKDKARFLPVRLENFPGAGQSRSEAARMKRSENAARKAAIPQPAPSQIAHTNTPCNGVKLPACKGNLLWHHLPDVGFRCAIP